MCWGAWRSQHEEMARSEVQRGPELANDKQSTPVGAQRQRQGPGWGWPSMTGLEMKSALARGRQDSAEGLGTWDGLGETQPRQG